MNSSGRSSRPSTAPAVEVVWNDARMSREVATDAPTPHLILLSGGIDSAAALALICQAGSPVSALFVDYGQGAAASEARASAALAVHFGVKRQTLTCSGSNFGAGEIRGRNAFLTHLALMTFQGETGVVVMGIHAGTVYRDCSSDFVDLIQQSYDFHVGGRISLAAPFVDYFKADVFNLALKIGLPVELTYSCEAANEPCGMCVSCCDREELLART
jgi:7-cyano-7-deazaguanine synthase